MILGKRERENEPSKTTIEEILQSNNFDNLAEYEGIIVTSFEAAKSFLKILKIKNLIWF